MMPTKEQVLKRLAEIEGAELRPSGCYIGGEAVQYYYIGKSRWNPLDNPADAYALIEKYKLSVEPYDSVMWDVRRGSSVCVGHEALPWAICLAVIEANGGMGDE